NPRTIRDPEGLPGKRFPGSPFFIPRTMRMNDSVEAAILKAAEAIRSSRHLIAFTGAGISVESGVPAFRGEGGIWNRVDPDALKLERFRSDPKGSWAVIRELFYSAPEAPRPNAAHLVLAAWEAAGILDFLVTQNIDGLHRQAGSIKLAEFHGSLSELICAACGAVYPADAALVAQEPPCCSARKADGRVCGAPLKPRFVFFGEDIPRDAYVAAFAAAERADACLIVGSTGLVYPAAEVPILVKRHGGTVIEVDPSETEFTQSIADFHIALGASEALRRLDALVRRPGAKVNRA
ncbi:MAG: Sir2 family NAD-dependent protein deacetylase, partial [Spirochaetaceae bacterium]|nr:Sir2 family NAD-dependent protein deacetylase [Spirochaetaceae bacterium]